MPCDIICTSFRSVPCYPDKYCPYYKISKDIGERRRSRVIRALLSPETSAHLADATTLMTANHHPLRNVTATLLFVRGMETLSRSDIVASNQFLRRNRLLHVPERRIFVFKA
jgi:hypothetical protein